MERGRHLLSSVWRFSRPRIVASTAAAGGGLGERRWVLNAQVAREHAIPDSPPHIAELAGLFGLDGPGVAMFAAADAQRSHRAEDAGVAVEATVGLSRPAWSTASSAEIEARAGTINIVALLPARLSPAGLLNALCTATEAKTQALLDAGLSGTAMGTPAGAIAVACPARGPEDPFGGPRSVWGARLARAVHEAVLSGARSGMTSGSW